MTQNRVEFINIGQVRRAKIGSAAKTWIVVIWKDMDYKGLYENILFDRNEGEGSTMLN